MKLSRIGMLFILFVVLQASFAQGQPKWLDKMKQIRLLVASYEEVLGVFGTPVDRTTEREYSEYFDLDGGRAWVGFSSSWCGEKESSGRNDRWNVPEYTAISVSFRPDRPINPNQLQIDVRGFTKTPIEDVPGSWIYRNETLGMEYTTTPLGKIEEVELFPPTPWVRPRTQCKSQ